jgi:hypothetical protein
MQKQSLVLWGHISFKKGLCAPKDFVKNFGLLIIKNHLPIQVVDSIFG